MVKQYFVLLIFIFLSICIRINAQKEKEYSVGKKMELIKAHNKAFVSMGEKVRDPFILVAPDGNYYLTGTTAGAHWGDTVGVKIWRSADLCKWESLGFVWQLNRDGKEGWFLNRPPKDATAKNLYAVWAPEIHYFKNTWWLTVSRNGGGNGLLKSTSGKVTGPYVETKIQYDRGIDSHLFSDQGNVYYMYGYNQLAKMDDKMESLVDNKFDSLTLPGKHPIGYEGILMMKYANKYLWIASGRYGYEPSNTYDLYYAVSNNLREGYSPRRMLIKNAGHGNIFQDKKGKWWCTAFDHEFTEQWCCWLVPIEIKEKNADVLIEVLDERFKPTEEDQTVVRKLAKTGIPVQWKDKTFWWRPKK